ncbi:MAG: ATP-binding protein [Pseudomonadales bacterium]
MLSRLARGPRLGAKLLILMSFALVVIPWFSYLYLSEMEDFLVDSQAKAQLLTAEGISTLLNGRSDLFYELPLSPEGYEKLYAHPLANPIRIDGKDNDWEDILQYRIGFGADEDTAKSQFYLSLGEHNDQLNALVTVADNSLVFRDRNILRLDLSDHLRITLGQGSDVQKIVITSAEPGVTTAYLVDDSITEDETDEVWRHAVQGAAELRIPGFMTSTADGYAVEFRIPLELLGSSRQFGLAVVDVDDAETREIVSITGTLPSAEHGAFDLVLMESPEVLRIIQGLGYAGANIQVIDDKKRVRAEQGSYEAHTTASDDTDTGWRDTWFALVDYLMYPLYNIIESNLRAGSVATNDAVLNSALTGTAAWQRQYSNEEGEVITAAHPIISQDQVIGTVLLQQNTNQITELRRGALQRIVNFSLISILIFFALILLFSLRLAGRIRKLGTEATGAIDDHGRLRTNKISAETSSGDEIGDLARSISGMLSRLHQHNQFLENMPRTLRHEINNPLNTLSTSLQNLEADHSPGARDKYLAAAKRGVMRIGMIVQSLADAASLEDALQAEELEVVNLQQLVQNYLNNASSIHPNRKLRYLGTNAEVLAKVSDYRVEQLLDKLIDNAVDFSIPESVITIGLAKRQEHLLLSVANQGPTLTSDMAATMFDSMMSVRKSNPDNRLHFGMGLYVVRVIAEHHGGSVAASNLEDSTGIRVEVRLPLHRKPRENKPQSNEAALALPHPEMKVQDATS